MNQRAVRIVTDVAAVDRQFDYLVTEQTSRVAVGDRVRVDFNNRSVRGWVVADATPIAGLKPLAKWLGFGPAPTLLPLLEWVSLRWYAPLSRVLLSATPRRIVSVLPSPPRPRRLANEVAVAGEYRDPGVLQVAPTTDPLPLILAAYQSTVDRNGSFLVMVPTEAWAARLRGRLEQRGCDVASGEAQWDRMRAGWPVIVGARGAALAPTGRLSGAVIVDADDEAYRSEAAPTWDAPSVVAERCRLDGAPLWVCSMLPSPQLLGSGTYQRDDNLEGGWPVTHVVDRRTADPHDGVLARQTLELAHRALDGPEPVALVVVLQRLGAGRLLACRRCGELARCQVCDQPEQENGDLVGCASAHELRPAFCRACGASALKRVRVGVSTLARDVSAQLSQPVSEVTAASDPAAPLARVVVGTEAVFARVRRCALVVFVDFDQYLLARRSEARQRAIVAVGKASRLVGSRREARGSVVLQTRRPDDLVVTSLVTGSFDQIVEADVTTARELGLPPFAAQAQISGPGASEFVEHLADVGLTVDRGDGVFVVRAGDVSTLTRALREAPRPGERLRVAVW